MREGIVYLRIENFEQTEICPCNYETSCVQIDTETNVSINDSSIASKILHMQECIGSSCDRTVYIGKIK